MSTTLTSKCQATISKRIRGGLNLAPGCSADFAVNREGDVVIHNSFAGSGTTGHAVLRQNPKDRGKRRFILVEMDENIARNVTAERVKRVVTGYTNVKGNCHAPPPASLPHGPARSRPDHGAGLSEGRCRFVMVKDKRWEWIEEHLK